MATKISQSVCTKLDGKEFYRVILAHSSTIAKLRIRLDTKHSLPPNTHFLDTKGYRIAREDEEIEIIELLLRENNIVLMESDEVIPGQSTSANTSATKNQGTDFVNKCSTFITTELFSILGWLWRFPLKPLIILSLMALVSYYSYSKLVCRHGRSLPFVTMYCPVEFEFISLPPLSKLANNSASLAETLINTDVSAPMRCVQAKNALIELRAKIIYSDIDINIRTKLGIEMQELEKLIRTGADDLTDTLASFGGALERLELYVKFGLDDLSKLIDSETQRGNGLLQIGSSEMAQIATLNTSFQNYMTLMNKDVDEVLFKAQDTQMSLKRIEEKLKTIQELNYKGKHISQSRIDELQHGSYWSWLFEEGQLGIIKHQRNIKTLDEFVSFVTETLNNIGYIIIKLKSFKNNATNLKKTTAILDQFPIKSVNEHKQLLEAALNRLTQSKETFEGKLEKTKRQSQAA